VNFKLDTSTRRIAFAALFSVLLHAWMMWGPHLQLPRFGSSLPTLTARLETLPGAPATPKPKRKAKIAAPKPAPEPVAEAIPEPVPEPTPEVPAPSVAEAAAASAPVVAETLATADERPAPRTPLPQHAELTFAIYKGTSNFKIGEAIHTLDIQDGHYVLKAVTQTTGLARVFKSYELIQTSSGSYYDYGLQPEQFVDERKDSLGTQHIAVEFDRNEHLAHFSQGGEVSLPAETQDILSVLYQFPPLQNREISSIYVSNGKKIEYYDFEISANEKTDTVLGELLTVRLRKMHGPNEEGLEIWLAREFRLFPVKMRFIEKNGEISGEAVITDMRVSPEEGIPKNVAN
jgi:hypothetical protein